MTGLQTMMSAMVEFGARAVAEATGARVDIRQIASVPAADALGGTAMMVSKSQLTAGSQIGSLLTAVPASGIAAAGTALDAIKLTDALVSGALAGIAGAGGPMFRALSPQFVTSPAEVDLIGAEAFAFDLVVGASSTTAFWVVEATLGSLLGGSSPVEEPAAEGPSVAPASLPDLGRAGTVPANHDISILSDVMSRVSVEIARGTAKVEDLVSMGPGSVFELDREAGDEVDIRVNGAMVARGDIIVVGNQLGVRISKVCEPVQ